MRSGRVPSQWHALWPLLTDAGPRKTGAGAQQALSAASSAFWAGEEDAHTCSL